MPRQVGENYRGEQRRWSVRAVVMLWPIYIVIGAIVMTAAFVPRSIVDALAGMACICLLFWQAAAVGASATTVTLMLLPGWIMDRFYESYRTGQLSDSAVWNITRRTAGFTGGCAFAGSVWLTLLVNPSLTLVFADQSLLIVAALLAGFIAGAMGGFLVSPFPTPESNRRGKELRAYA